MRVGLLVAVIAIAACTQTPLQFGKELMSDPTVSDAPSNRFTCSTCHETDAQPTHLRPGYTLYDSTVRASWWGGYTLTWLDSVNQCVVNFMRGTPLPIDDDRSRGLYAYARSISPDATAPGLPITIVQNIVDIPSGDASMGNTRYHDGCAKCHGEPHTGAGRLSSIVSIIPDDSLAAHGTDPVTGARPVVIEKTRHGKFFNVGGNMAPYSLEALSDAQLGDLLAYLEQFGLPPYVAPAM